MAGNTGREVLLVGMTGPQGPPGPAGANGSGGDLNFTFTQAIAAASWVINHNLGKFPSVSVVDSGGSWVIGDVSYTNANSLTVTFGAAFTGVCYLN